MSIKGCMDEITSLKVELKRVSITKANLVKKIKILENEVIEYLNEKDLPGVKHNGSAMIIKKASARERKTPKDRDDDAIRILKSNGINNASDVLKQLLEARKGELMEKQKLKFIEKGF